MFSTCGYTVKKTSYSGDQGADLIVEKEGLSFAVQCKDSARVGNKAVQEVLAAQRFYKTDYAVVVTSGEFTKAARELAATTDAYLIGDAEIEKLFKFLR